MGNSLVVIGAGHVGSYVLADAASSGLFRDIAVIDVDEGVAHGEALDQHHATALLSRTNTRIHAGTYADCAGADVIINCGGALDHPRSR
ncbi:hypothetical protein GCM10027031_06940 [Corynebacterium atrinae]|nr:hypothetical protein [Corynebacterium atrinae]